MDPSVTRKSMARITVQVSRLAASSNSAGATTGDAQSSTTPASRIASNDQRRGLNEVNPCTGDPGVIPPCRALRATTPLVFRFICPCWQMAMKTAFSQ